METKSQTIGETGTTASETQLAQFEDSRSALAAFAECSGRLSEFIETISASREELAREVETIKERESRINSELGRLRSLDEENEKNKLSIAESERRRLALEELLKSAEDEIKTKSDALTTLRVDYKEILERHNTTTADFEVSRVGLADSERKLAHFEEEAKSGQKELRIRRKELADLNLKLLEQTSILNGTEAKLQEVEAALSRSANDLVVQGQELKETKRELVERREELRSATGELARKNALLEQCETELQERGELIRTLQDDLADSRRDLQRATSLNLENEEALNRANSKITEQSASMLNLDRDLAKAQDEAEQKRRALRQSEEKRKLDEAERLVIEQDLKNTADSLKKKISLLELQEKQSETLTSRLNAEIQKRRDVEEQRSRARADIQMLRDNLAQMEEQVKGSLTQSRIAEDESAGLKTELEALQHEHKNLLRLESRQAEELERVVLELNKKSELLRETQSKGSALREQLDHSKLKLDQQSTAIAGFQQRHARDQEELQTYKRQLQKAARLPQLEAEMDELKQELKAMGLRIEQKDDLIGMLQTRLNEKRVVPIASREAQPGNGSESEQKFSPGLKIASNKGFSSPAS